MRFPTAHAARALFCAAGALAAFASLAQATAQVPAQVPAQEHHFLWEVSSMTNKVYLFGTIHAGKKEWYPLAREIEEAFDASPVLVVEADISNRDAMAKGTESMSYEPPDELSKHVPPADYERFLRLLGRYSLPEREMTRLKPFTAVSMLIFGEGARNGYLPEYGVDAYLLLRAKSQRKKIVELEGVEAQAKLLASLTEADHRQAFTGTLDALESGLTADQFDGLAKAWQSGDAFLMREVARRYNEKVPGAAELEERFVWSRHDEMLAKIEGFLNQGKQRHFIALGSLHLTGKRGLVEMLKARHYLVRQM